MRSNVKFRLALSAAILCFMSGCYVPFNDTEEPHEPTITTEPGKITSENYFDFGKIIAAEEDHVLVCSHQAIHIFKYNSSDIELIQSIELADTCFISSMIVYRSELIFSYVDLDGTGTVCIYKRIGDLWELSQEIRKERSHDMFGWAIDRDGETMVIGANSFRSDCTDANACQGIVYVFQKQEGVWVEKQEILAEQTEAGDWFGHCVGIYGDLMLAGSPEQPLHLYKFNGEWELLRTEEIYARAIAHSENNFMVYGDDEFRAFLLEPDGSFSENVISSVSQHNISWEGEIIEMQDSLAIVDMISSGSYLLKYWDRQWILETIYSPDPGENCTFQGMAITDRYAIIGGMDYEDGYQYGYVYFRDL